MKFPPTKDSTGKVCTLFEPGQKALLESREDVVGALDRLVKEAEGREDEWANKTKEFARGALKQLCPERLEPISGNLSICFRCKENLTDLTSRNVKNEFIFSAA